MTKRIYIAGPMTGHPEFNFPAFDSAQQYLANIGYQTTSPAEEDRKVGFNSVGLSGNEDLALHGFDLDQAIRRCLDAVLRCDGIYMLSGWETSKGAKTEHALAVWAGKEIMIQGEDS